MASSSQVRSWWTGYECASQKMVKVTFPGEGRTWSLSVADASAPVWKAAAQIMESEPYLFRESAGGTYNCRPPSLHAYGLAIDLNPSVNPYDCPMQTDMPTSFITRMEGIRANGKQALQWGGRWACSNPPDPMHYQINVAPGDIDEVTWDSGDGGTMTWKKPGDPIKTITDADLALANQGGLLTPGPTQGQASYNPSSDAELNDRIWIVLGRVADQFVLMDQRLRKGGL